MVGYTRVSYSCRVQSRHLAPPSVQTLKRHCLPQYLSATEHPNNFFFLSDLVRLLKKYSQMGLQVTLQTDQVSVRHGDFEVTGDHLAAG